MALDKGKFVIGMDVGGTKILTVLLNSNFEVVHETKAKVDAGKGEKTFFETVEKSIETVLAEAKVGRDMVSAMGMGCPGMFKMPQGVVKLSPNLPFLKNTPLKSKLSKMTKWTVAVENDVNAGLYGEQRLGAAKGVKHVAGFFLGTGVGGALIIDGKLHRGASGGAGEVGHTFLALPTFMEGAPKEGTVEATLGRTRIAADAAVLLMKGLAPGLHGIVGYDVKKIKSNAIARAIKSGDSALHELIVLKAQALGIAMANVVNLLNPSLIVLGGGLMEAMGDIILPAARDTMRKYAMGPLVEDVKVVAAKLKDHSVAMGAAKLAVEALEGGEDHA